MSTKGIAILIDNGDLGGLLSISNNEKTTLNKPKLRQSIIFDEIKTLHTVILTENMYKDMINYLSDTHESQYIKFLQSAYESWLAENEHDMDYSKDGGLIPYHFCKNKPDHFHQLAPWKQMGYYASDSITPIYETTFQNIMKSAHNSYVAAHWLINNMNYRIIYCLNSVPGHHARYDGYGGYCFLNNAMICANVLVGCYGKKVAMIDVDYHAGDGASDILKNQPNKNIQAYSIHANPEKDYPSYGGWPSEFDIIFPKKATWEQYKLCLMDVINKIKKFNPDVLIIPFGGDTYANDIDPSVLYGCSLEIKDYYLMGELLSYNFPDKHFIITQEGGYNYTAIANILKEFLCGLGNCLLD